MKSTIDEFLHVTDHDNAFNPMYPIKQERLCLPEKRKIQTEVREISKTLPLCWVFVC